VESEDVESEDVESEERGMREAILFQNIRQKIQYEFSPVCKVSTAAGQGESARSRRRPNVPTASGRRR